MLERMGQTLNGERRPSEPSATSVPESEDAIRNLKASQSVETAFAAQRIATPPADIAAILTNAVKSAVKGLPLNEVRNMTPGSGVLGSAAAAAVDQYLGMLNPAQREATKVGDNMLDSGAMLRLNALLNPLSDAGRLGRGAQRDGADGASSSFAYERMNGFANLSPAEKLTYNYAIDQGVRWAAENRDILKLGPAAIDILKQTHLRKDVYEGLTKKAGLSSAGAVGIAKVLHDRGEDANEGGKEITKDLTAINDPAYSKAVQRLGETHGDPKATPEQKAEAVEGLKNAGEESVQRHPEHRERVERTQKRLGAATERNDKTHKIDADQSNATAKQGASVAKQTASSAQTVAEKKNTRASTQAKMDAF